jgi:hypothetical protein
VLKNKLISFCKLKSFLGIGPKRNDDDDDDVDDDNDNDDDDIKTERAHESRFLS